MEGESPTLKSFDTYIFPISNMLPEKKLKLDKLKVALNILKTKKSSGFDDTGVIIMKRCYWEDLISLK